MHINIYEIIAFSISLISLIYGVFFLTNKDLYNKFFVYAAGCYFLEELWVIVNNIFGHVEGLVTVRLFGLFGTYLFLLSASIYQLEKVKDKSKSIKINSLILPLILTTIFVLFLDKNNMFVEIIMAIPVIFASYFNMKYILLSKTNKKLEKNKLINLFCLIFYSINLVYLFPLVSSSIIMLEISDILVSIVMLILVVLCKWGVNNE